MNESDILDNTEFETSEFRDQSVDQMDFKEIHDNYKNDYYSKYKLDNLESVANIDINVAYMKIITEKSKVNLDRSEISIDVVCHSMGCRALLLNLF